MLYNADEYGLNAHEEIQTPYSDYDPKKDPEVIARINSLNKHRKEELSKIGSYNHYPIAGAAIGGGIGYGIGRYYAKKTPIIAQQRKRKLIGTLIGTAIGGGIGYKIKQNKIKEKADPINRAYARKANGIIEGGWIRDFDRRRAKGEELRNKKYEQSVNKTDPNLSAAPVTPTSPSEPHKSSTVSEAVSKWNQKFGKFFKK